MSNCNLINYYFSTHMQDLQEVTQEVHYENYRSERLAKGAPVPPRRQTYVCSCNILENN